MWEKIKVKLALLWVQVQPELYRFIKLLLKVSVDTLLPIAIEAVTQAAIQKGSGQDKFNYATNYVKAQAPKAEVSAVLNAVRIAYGDKVGKLSEY